MYKITIEDNGVKREYTDVLGFDFVMVEDLEYYASKINNEIELTDKEIIKIEKIISNLETFPTHDEVRSFVKDVINERQGE